MGVFEDNQLVDWSTSRFFNPKVDIKLACSCCGLCSPTQGIIDLINQIRVDFGRMILINSGTRCPNHNSKIGGAKKSYHLALPDQDVHSRALDIRPVSSKNMDELQRLCEIYLMDKGGLIRYDNFIHIDTRKEKLRIL